MTLRKLLKESHRFIFSVVSTCMEIFPDTNWGNRFRGIVLGAFMKGSRARLQICKGVHVLYPQLVTIGDDVYIGFNSWINAQAGLRIDDEVIIGPFVAIATGNHVKLGRSYRFGEHVKKPVRVRAGAWLAAHVSVMPGVDVAERTVAAAGAVLSKSTTADSVYGGVPAKFISEVR